MLELQGVFCSHERGVLVVVVQVVVELRRMEFAWVAQGFSSNCPVIFFGKTTLIKAEVVYVVLLAVFLKLCKSFFCV